MESPYVFISYNSLQKEQAEQMRETLKHHKIECWMAPDSIPGGSRYANEITSAIENCSAFILLLSPSAQRSHWVEIETHLAFEFRKVILPFVVEECELTGSFKLYLTNIQFYEAFRDQRPALDKMLLRIHSVMKSPAQSEVENIHSVGSHGGGEQYQKSKRHWIAILLPTLIYVFGLCTPLFLHYYDAPFSFWMRLAYLVWYTLGICWVLNAIETRPAIAVLCFGSLREKELNMKTDEVRSAITRHFGNGHFISNECPEGFVSFCKMELIEFGSWDGQKVNYMKVEFCRSLQWYTPSVLYLHSLSKGDQALKMLVRQGFVIKTPPACFAPSTMYLSKGDLHISVYHNQRKALRCAIVYNCNENEIADHFQGEWQECFGKN